MVEDAARYQAQIAEPHSLLSAVTDHLLFDELDKFGVWDIMRRIDLSPARSPLVIMRH